AGCGAGEALRLPALHPRELRRGHAGVEAGAGERVVVAVGVGSKVFHDQARRAGVEPEKSAAHRFARGVDEPRAVALRRHAEGGHAMRKIRHAQAKFAQARRAIGPGPRHVLLDLAAAEGLVDIGARGDGELLAGKRKCNRLDDGRAGVDSDENIASHGRAILLRTKARFMPLRARATKPPTWPRRTRAGPRAGRQTAPARRPWPGSARATRRP